VGLALALIIAGLVVWLVAVFASHVIIGIILLVIGLVLLVNGYGPWRGSGQRRVWY
jgi:membrane-bound ClpP family serine protease